MGSESSVIEKIKPVECIKEIQGVFGNYDVLVKLQCPTVKEISEIITTKIRSVGQVKCTTTLMCAN
jgi:DNA-binding Lrp family transcriptional regulator